MRHGSTLAPIALVFALGSLASARDEAPLPDSRLGQPTQPLLLLTRPDVRDDLKMDADQTASAEEAVRAFYLQAYALRGQPTNPETLRARRAVDEAAQAWIDSKLTSEQQGRLAQIHLQWEGPSALVRRPVVADALRLTDEQKAELAGAVKARDDARARGHVDADQVLGQAALRCLNPSQREGWARMMGHAFTPRLASRTETKALR